MDDRSPGSAKSGVAKAVSGDLTVEMVEDGVALLTLNRPPANALTLNLRLRIRDSWAALRDMDDVRAVVVASARERYFCTGLDLNELAQDLEDPAKDADRRHADVDQLEWDPASVGLWKPIIAAINGYCLAGGFYLATMCDIRVAGADARFGVPEIRWSYPAVFTWSLANSLLPMNIVAEMVLWADTQVTADRLFQLGFVNEVVPTNDVLRRAIEWARRISRHDTVAVQRHKEMLYRAALPDHAHRRREAESLLRPLHDRVEVSQRQIRKFLDRAPRQVRGGEGRGASQKEEEIRWHPDA